MKYIYMAITLVLTMRCQTSNPEKALEYWEVNYLPIQREFVSNTKYRKSMNILTETYQGIRDDSTRPKYIDHINIVTAFLALREPKKMVLEQLFIAQKKDLVSTAELFLLLYKRESFIDYLSDKEYDSLRKKFIKINKYNEEKDINIVSYSENGCYNLELIRLINHLAKKDQEHRKSGNENFNKQEVLDTENLHIIDSLYKQYGTYVGDKLVGKEYKNVMWAIIQHAELPVQENYLPIIYDATKEQNISNSPLKMLIDRIYNRKYGYQIYGSQGGANLAPDSIISEVKQKYSL